MNKIAIAFGVLTALTSVTLAQQTNYTLYNNRCLDCVYQTRPGFYCGSNRVCYSTLPAANITNLSTCGNTIETCLQYPNIVLQNHTIDKLDITPVQRNINIPRGQSAIIGMKSQTSKSAFVNITYDDPSKKRGNDKVVFYVWNDRIGRNKKFEMSYNDEVLLPNSEDSFVIWLGANNSDFRVSIFAANSKTLVASVMAIFAFAFASLSLF
jgi:hypothetical protein